MHNETLKKNTVKHSKNAQQNTQNLHNGIDKNKKIW